MDHVLQRIAERTSALAQFKKKGNLEKEFIFCVALAKDHEVAALHCKPVPFPSRSNSSNNNNNNDRIAHLQLALQFYRSALEISADLPTQQRQNCHHTELKLAVCRVLLEGGAVDDFSDYVQKAIPEGGKLRGEALLLAGQRYARLAGYQIPAILALEEAKRLLTECPEADRPECLLLCAQASAELAALLRKPESHSQRDSAIGLLETVKSIDTDERVKIRADAQLAKVFLDAVGDVNGSFSFCLEAVDASRRLRQSSSSSHAKPTRPDQLIYCELLLLAGRLYRLQGDFRSAQTNLLLAKDEAINVVAPWDLIRQIEGEILLATERSTISSPAAAAAAAKAASNDPELDPLTGQFLQTRDDRLAEEVLSRLAIRRLQAKQPLHYDPDFSYFADRKPTAVANRLFAAGMNIKPKSNKKHTLDLKRKRGRKPAGMGLTVHSQQRTTRTRVSRSAHSDGSDEDGYEEEEEEEDFIDDGAVDELSDSSPEKPPPPPPLLKLTKKRTIDPVPLIIVSSESEDEDEDAARLLTPPPIAANLQQLSLATATTDEKASPLPFHSKGSPVAEFPLMMFDSPVFEREKENRLGSQLKESFTLFNDDDDDNGRNDGAKQPLGGTQQATQASLKRITVKFQNECQSEPILLPLGGLSTISELIRRLQGRLDVLRSGQEAARLTVEGVAKLPGRARIFPEDLIEDVLVEGDELLALCCRSSSSSSEASAQDAGSKPAAATFAGGSCSVFSEIAEKHRLLGLRRAPVHECLLLQVFESRLRKAIGSDLLDLSGLSIDSNGWRELSPLLRRFLEQNQSINRLSLRMNMLTEADVQPLLQGPRLGRVSSLDVAVNLICECDCQEAKWLTSLDLSYNPLRRLHLLSSTAVLLEVSLVECGLHLSGADAGMFVVGGCEVLRVGGSTTFDSEFLAELCKSTSLRAISLFACSLPPGTLGTLALLPSLRMADFEHCEGLRVAALCSFVRRCSALEELRVDGGLSAEEAAEVKRVAFRDSATLRRFDWVGATDEAVEE